MIVAVVSLVDEAINEMTGGIGEKFAVYEALAVTLVSMRVADVEPSDQFAKL